MKARRDLSRMVTLEMAPSEAVRIRLALLAAGKIAAAQIDNHADPKLFETERADFAAWLATINAAVKRIDFQLAYLQWQAAPSDVARVVGFE